MTHLVQIALQTTISRTCKSENCNNTLHFFFWAAGKTWVLIIYLTVLLWQGDLENWITESQKGMLFNMKDLGLQITNNLSNKLTIYLFCLTMAQNHQINVKTLMKQQAFCQHSNSHDTFEGTWRYERHTYMVTISFSFTFCQGNRKNTRQVFLSQWLHCPKAYKWKL